MENDRPAYYGFVKHSFPDTPFTFTKGLIAKLKNEEPPVEPYETCFRVALERKLEHLENLGKDKTQVTLWGQLGHCYEIINFASGLYWEADLKNAKADNKFNGPSEFTMHIWHKIDDYNYESVSDITFKGVKWLDAAHAGSDGASDCWGIVSFECEETVKNVSYKPLVCEIPKDIKYPSLYIGRLLFEHSKERTENVN